MRQACGRNCCHCRSGCGCYCCDSLVVRLPLLWLMCMLCPLHVLHLLGMQCLAEGA